MASSSFDTTSPSPRVNSVQLNGFVGRRVLLVGRALTGDRAMVQAADDGVVEVKIGNVGPLPEKKIVEIAGVVEAPGVIREDQRTMFSDNFDLKAYNELCLLSNTKYQDLFMQ